MKRILTALVAAATLVGASALGLGLGPWRFCSRSRCRQRTGVIVLLSLRLLWLLRAVSLSAALRVAQCVEWLRLGARLRLTGT